MLKKTIRKPEKSSPVSDLKTFLKSFSKAEIVLPINLTICGNFSKSLIKKSNINPHKKAKK